MIRRMILKILYPFNKLMGKVGIHRKFSDVQYKELLSKIKPGDIILSRKRFELSNLFIQGLYKHAVFFTGENIIIESTGNGVSKSSLPRFLFDKDSIALLRPLYEHPIEIEYSIALAEKFAEIKIEYDYFFEDTDKAFYCSELVWTILRLNSPKFQKFTKRKTMGVNTVIPMDFYYAQKYFDLITEYRNGL